MPVSSSYMPLWYNQPVPILRCLDAFSLFVCAEFAPDAQTAEAYLEEAKLAVNRMFNREVKANQRVNIRRQPRSGRGSSSSSCY